MHFMNLIRRGCFSAVMLFRSIERNPSHVLRVLMPPKGLLWLWRATATSYLCPAHQGWLYPRSSMQHLF